MAWSESGPATVAAVSDAPHDPPALQHTLQGDDLSWLHLMLDGVLPSRYVLPANRSDQTSEASAQGEVAATLTIDEAAVGDHIDLLDPEGVTLASLTVAEVDGDNVGGPVERRSGFSIVDHVDLRLSPDASRAVAIGATGATWALWVDSPLSFAFREAVRADARAHDARVLEIVPVPTGDETSRSANAPVRVALAHTTRDDADRVIVVPWPSHVEPARRHQLQVHVAHAYGATEWVASSPQSAQSEEGPVPVRLVDIDADQQSISTDALDAWVVTRTPLPAWAAEPAVADVLAKVHRPTSRTGLTVLLSGLSGSGKSTVARALAVRLVARDSRSVSLLDGDVVRHHLSKGLGFSRPDRITNVLRIGFVASEITKAGGIAVCCPIAPYDETRKEVRAMVEAHGSFVLVHVATPLAECERRDRKGLYAKARRGEIPEFTGISDPYDEPEDAEVVLDTTGRTIEACVDDVYQALVDRGLVQ